MAHVTVSYPWTRGRCTWVARAALISSPYCRSVYQPLPTNEVAVVLLVNVGG
jgi:hypothetical protein